MTEREILFQEHQIQKDRYEIFFIGSLNLTTTYTFQQPMYMKDMWPFFSSITPNINDYIRVTFDDLMTAYDAREPYFQESGAGAKVGGLSMPFGPNTPDIYPIERVVTRVRFVFFQGSAPTRQVYWRMRPLTEFETRLYA